MMVLAMILIGFIGLMALNNRYTSESIMMRISEYKRTNVSLGLSEDATYMQTYDGSFVSVKDCKADPRGIPKHRLHLAIGRQRGLERLYTQLERSMG